MVVVLYSNTSQPLSDIPVGLTSTAPLVSPTRRSASLELNRLYFPVNSGGYIPTSQPRPAFFKEKLVYK